MKVATVLKSTFLSGSVILLFCSKNPVDPRMTDIIVNGDAIVATTSSPTTYTVGNVGIVMTSDYTTYKNLLPVYGDNAIRTYDGAIYILERWGKDNVIKIGGSSTSNRTIDYQVNIGQNINIQDIAFASSSKAYITANLSSQLIIFDPRDGSISDSLDLSAYAAYAGTDSAEHVPYVASASIYGSYLYIACQRLKVSGGFPMPADLSSILVIATQNDSVVKNIKLTLRNPQSMDTAGGKIYVSSAGAWYDLTDGGIERIDILTGNNEGLILSETQLQGDASTVTMISPDKGYVAVGKGMYPDNFTEIIPFNPITKTMGTAIQDIDNAFGGMIYNGQYLFVGDRSKTRPGIIAVDPATDKKIAGPFNVGMPPNSLAFLKVE